MKRLIEYKQDLEIQTVTRKLENLSELDRVLSSKNLCRRQYLLRLLDESRNDRCRDSEEEKCDNCRLESQPSFRVVTNVVLSILEFFSSHPNVDVFDLRKIFVALNYDDF